MIILPLLKFLAPHDCILCGQEDYLLCLSCRLSECTPLPSRCYRCHRLSTDFKTCQSCSSSSSLKNVWIAGQFEEPLKDLIYLLKFKRAQAAARELAEILDECLPYMPHPPLVISIPTASSRVRSRGYDQAKLIAKELASIRGWQHQALLKRSGQQRQTGKGREERLKQLTSSFWAIKPWLIKGSNILLVDDVLTTGATLESAAKVLRAAGAKTVMAAVCAQTL